MKGSVAVTIFLMLPMSMVFSARAATVEYFLNRNSLSDWTPFQITPFDSSLGTLNSVTMSAEVNVSGSAQLWSADEEAVLSVIFTTTLAPVTEMGWGPTVARFEDYTPLWYYDYDFGEGYAQLDGSDNTADFNMITVNFGRFTGEDPFDITLQVFGQAISTRQGEINLDDIVVSSYDGTASLYYSYDYTPSVVPEPSPSVLAGMGLLVLSAIHRRRTSYLRS